MKTLNESQKSKLNLCVKIYRIYKPMSDVTDKWINSLPNGIKIELPFDDKKFFIEVLISILDIQINLDENDFLYSEDYSENEFIEYISNIL